MKMIFVFLAALVAAIVCDGAHVSASAQPCSWTYSTSGGTSTASYCGNVVVLGNITELSPPTQAYLTSMFGSGLAVGPTYLVSCDGTQDNVPPIQNGLNYLNSVGGGDLVIYSPGTCLVSAGHKIAIYANTRVDTYGVTFVPMGNAIAGTPVFDVQGPNVTVDCHNSGGFDGKDSTHNWWTVMTAFGVSNPTSANPAFLSNVHFKNCFVRNIGMGQTSPLSALYFEGTDTSSIENVQITNFGSSTNFQGDQFVEAIGVIVSQRFTLDHVTCDYCGNSDVQDSGGLYNITTNNSFSYCKLYCLKGGYYSPYTITASTGGTFTVANSSYARAAFSLGHAFIIEEPCCTSYTGHVVNVDVHDDTSTITITSDLPFANAPSVGDFVEPLNTGAIYDHNYIYFSGDNGFDLNGIWDALITHTVAYNCGEYGGDGDQGHGKCIWVGFDPQQDSQRETFNYFYNSGNHILDNNLLHSAGSAIVDAEAPVNSIVSGNLIQYSDEDNFSGEAGIYANSTAYRNGTQNQISNNTVTAVYGSCITNTGNTHDYILNNACFTPDQSYLPSTSFYFGPTTASVGVVLASCTFNTGQSCRASFNGIGSLYSNNSQSFSAIVTGNSGGGVVNFTDLGHTGTSPITSANLMAVVVGNTLSLRYMPPASSIFVYGQQNSMGNN